MDFDNVDDLIGNYYRELIAQELEQSLFSEFSGRDDEEQTKWFNQGLRYAIILVRHGID
jgi:hypothetical protein